MIGVIVARSISQKCRLATWSFVPLLSLSDRLHASTLRKEMEESIGVYCTDEQKRDKTYMRRLRRELWYCYILYNLPFREYFMYHFGRLSHAGRLEFLTENEQVRLSRTYSSKQTRELFRDKWDAYRHFQKYYHRDMMPVEEGTTASDLAAFTAKHKKLVIKPRNRYFGDDVRLIDAAELPSLEELREQDVVLEEPVVQCDFMAQFHPASVNTIRIATGLKDGQPHVLFAILRMGRRGSFIDNAVSGGFAAVVDVDTGIVKTPGVTETFDYALLHPDSGAQIIGTHIPRWEELKELVKELAMVVPEQRYVGWDMALTDDGWVVIEGNHDGQLLTQYITQEGIHEYLHEYLDI